MTEAGTLAGVGIAAFLAAAAGGAVLGAAYLALLWRSVRGLVSAGHPGSWMLGGAVARTAGVGAGLWLVSSGDGLRLAAALAGFLAVRIATTAVVRRPTPHAGGDLPGSAAP